MRRSVVRTHSIRLLWSSRCHVFAKQLSACRGVCHQMFTHFFRVTSQNNESFVAGLNLVRCKETRGQMTEFTPTQNRSICALTEKPDEMKRDRAHLNKEQHNCSACSVQGYTQQGWPKHLTGFDWRIWARLNQNYYYWTEIWLSRVWNQRQAWLRDKPHLVAGSECDRSQLLSLFGFSFSSHEVDTRIHAV